MCHYLSEASLFVGIGDGSCHSFVQTPMELSHLAEELLVIISQVSDLPW